MSGTTNGNVRSRAFFPGPTRSLGRSIGVLVVAAIAVGGTTKSKAACWTRDALHNGLVSEAVQPQTILSAASVPVWRKVKFGMYQDVPALRGALDRAGCDMTDAATAMLDRPTFSLSGARTITDLFAVSVAELGFSGEAPALRDIYTRAQELGFTLAAAEVGPLLRLQYFAQAIGEFVNVGMRPVALPQGEPRIFVVANGGNGLLLMDQDAGASARFYPASRFVFLRQRKDLAKISARR